MEIQTKEVWPTVVKELHKAWTVLCSLQVLQTNCKLDQFENRPPVHKQVIQFFWSAHFWIYKAKWSLIETRLNGLEAGWISAAGTAWKLCKLARWLESGKTSSLWPEWHERWSTIYRSIQARYISQTQPMLEWITLIQQSTLTLVRSGLWNQQCKAKTNMQISDLPHSQIVVSSLFPWTFIGTCEGPLTMR